MVKRKRMKRSKKRFTVYVHLVKLESEKKPRVHVSNLKKDVTRHLDGYNRIKRTHDKGFIQVNKIKKVQL